MTKFNGKIAVLKGGYSDERAISLKTSENVEQALKELGFKYASIDCKDDFVEKLISSNFDLCFNALHGEFGEDDGNHMPAICHPLPVLIHRPVICRPLLRAFTGEPFAIHFCAHSQTSYLPSTGMPIHRPAICRPQSRHACHVYMLSSFVKTPNLQ